MPTNPPAQTALLLLCLAGCVSDHAYFEGSDTAELYDTDGAPNDSGDDTGGWDNVVPSWWSLAASVLVEEAQPVADDTSLEGWLLSEEADTDTPICSATFVPATLTETKPPDESIFHWWQIELQHQDGDCSGSQLHWFPETIEIGVGALHPDIAALLEPAGYEQIEGYLYGAYLRQGEQQGEVWAWGIAGTPASFDGEAEPVSAAPLPNGTYQMLPLYLLPLEGR